ncbi:MAG: hypothetical protein HRU34_20245 [Richelia sp.]|nr:hypothetical protein [Richelia sp.]
MDISAGTLVDTRQICFYNQQKIEALFKQGCELQSVENLQKTEEIQPQYLLHAEWRVNAQKIGNNHNL